jgi:peptidoglycan-associated lipoprotein
MQIMIASLLVGCGISKKPKHHWWQFWRTKPKATSSIDPSSTTLGMNEPPPPIDGAFDGSVDPINGMGDLSGNLQLAPTVREPFDTIADLQTVYFEYDQDAISDNSAVTLESNAAWILSNPQLHVQIEGHCDERGTLEYNLNLGQRRADIVREFLVMSGVEASRLHTISYGEERPIEVGFDESTFAQNRRVQFLVYDPNS